MTSEHEYTKWVSCWGTATSISDRTESTYSKDLTLRYPVKICFSGSKLRFRFSNLTGTEPVNVHKAFVALNNGKDYIPVSITVDNKVSFQIPCGKEITSDEIAFSVTAGSTVEVSMYFKDFTQMNAGTQIISSSFNAKYCYGDYSEKAELPADLSRNTKWIYFLNTIDILTEEENFAVICYGDSITCLSWTDELSKLLEAKGIKNLSVIRRAVCGTRILRQYDCITYQAYGLKGETRFSLEANVCGAKAIIIHHGINDIIHPVGTDINPFRPMSDMPTVDDLIQGTKCIYIDYAKKLGLKVYGATLLPIYGWRTYSEEKNQVRKDFNQWIRTTPDYDGLVDFDKAVRNPSLPDAFGEGFDSGDHLHPSDKACAAMAQAAFEALF